MTAPTPLPAALAEVLALETKWRAMADAITGTTWNAPNGHGNAARKDALTYCADALAAHGPALTRLLAAPASDEAVGDVPLPGVWQCETAMCPNLYDEPAVRAYGDARVAAALAARTAAPAEQGEVDVELAMESLDALTRIAAEAEGDVDAGTVLTLVDEARDVLCRLAPIAPDARGVEADGAREALSMLDAAIRQYEQEEVKAGTAMVGVIRARNTLRKAARTAPTPLARSVDGLSGEELDALKWCSDTELHGFIADAGYRVTAGKMAIVCAALRRLAGAKVPGGGE